MSAYPIALTSLLYRIIYSFRLIGRRMERTARKHKEPAIQAVIRSRYRHNVSPPIFFSLPPPDGSVVSHKGPIQYRYPFASRLRDASSSRRRIASSTTPFTFERSPGREEEWVVAPLAACIYARWQVWWMFRFYPWPPSPSPLRLRLTVRARARRAIRNVQSISLSIDFLPRSFSPRPLRRYLR